MLIESTSSNIDPAGPGRVFLTPISPLKKWSGLLVLSLALAIIIIDTTLLNVSLATIIRDLHTDIQKIQWVITAYSLTLAALTITGGRLGDLFGRKKMFILGAAIFAVGSYVASISHNVPTMIAGESIIEGIGAALMMPATASLLVANFRGRDRAIGFGIWGGVAAAAAAIGPILGGYLATNYSWRWGFRINIVVAALLIAGSVIIPESRDREERAALDWVGVLLSAFGLLSLVYGVIESSTYGWWHAKQLIHIRGIGVDLPGHLSLVPYAILIGALFLFTWWGWEQWMVERGETPLVSPKLFANTQFRSGAVTTMILSLGQAGLIFSVPVFLQAVRHLDAYHTGLSLLPMSITLLFVAPGAAFLSHKIRPKMLIMIGLLMNLLAFLVLRQAMDIDATAKSLALGMVFFGAGMGLVMSQINNFTLSAVSPEEAGEASGVNNTMRQLGSSLGSAILGAVLLGALTTNLTTSVSRSALIPDAAKSQLTAAIVAQGSNVEFGGSQQIEATLPGPLQTEVSHLVTVATVDANRLTLLWGAAFALLGLLSALQLPNVANVEREQSAAGGH